MGKKPAKSAAIPRRRVAHNVPPPSKPQPKQKRGGSTWPYVLLMMCGWAVIFAGIFFSHFLSGLPDVGNLMISGPSQDVTILDDRGRQIARRGLTQGLMVRAEDLPD